MSEGANGKIPTPDEIRWQHLEGAERTLLRMTPDFCVYLDEELEVDWGTTDEYQAQLDAQKIDTGKIQGVITCLEAIPVDHLERSVVRAFRSILGEAMCLALDQNIKGAQALLVKGEEFVVSRSAEN